LAEQPADHQRLVAGHRGHQRRPLGGTAQVHGQSAVHQEIGGILRSGECGGMEGGIPGFIAGSDVEATRDEFFHGCGVVGGARPQPIGCGQLVADLAEVGFYGVAGFPAGGKPSKRDCDHRAAPENPSKPVHERTIGLAASGFNPETSRATSRGSNSGS
jgi:hypothetical protein